MSVLSQTAAEKSHAKKSVQEAGLEALGKA